MVDRKKSNFPARQSVLSGASFDYFVNGVNYKISFSDLLPALGATGTIVQDGAVTGTPVLDKQGSVNNIRNLEDGSGILTSISPENGIAIKHNFTVNQTGVPILNNPTAASPTFPSLLSGAGIDIAQNVTNNTIEIRGTQVVTPTNTIIINTPGDFPVQDANTITLETGKIYLVDSSFSTAKRFITTSGPGGIVFTARNGFGVRVTYTGTGDMFTITDAFLEITKIEVAAPTSNFLFNVSSTTPGVYNFQCFFVGIGVINKFANFNNMFAFQFENVGVESYNQGISVTGSSPTVINITKVFLIGSAAGSIGLDLGSAVVPNIELSNFIVLGGSGSIGISGLANSGNVSPGAIATVDSCNFLGVTNALSGISSDDYRWDFEGTAGVPDSRQKSLITQTSGTLVTISAINTPVKIAGVWNDEGSRQFTASGDGRVTYDGEREIQRSITVSVSCDPVSGTNKDFTVYVALNGSVIANSGIPGRASAGDRVTITVPWQFTLNNGNYIEVFLENNTDTTDFNVNHAVVSVD